MFGLFVCSSLLEVSVVGLFVLRRHSDRSEEPRILHLLVAVFSSPAQALNQSMTMERNARKRQPKNS
jgi:hypothetical protein